jgi:MFS family permease
MPNRERLSAFQYRDFKLFFLGQLISLSGTWMQSVAQLWLVYSLTKSPFYLGIVAAISYLPILLFSAIGGVIADRFLKRNLLLLTSVLSIIPALLLGILTHLDIITVWQVAILAAFLGTVNAFDIPARQAFLVEMVGKRSLTNAIALNASAFHGARMIGPALAGITINYVGLSACFYLNALSFVAVIIALLKMNVTGTMKMHSKGFVKEFIEGVQFIKSKPEIYRIIFLIFIFSLIGIPYITFLPVFAVEVLQRGPEGFGFLASAAGTGALSAALFIALKGDIEKKDRYLSLSALCFSIALFTFSLSKVFFFSLVALVFVGWGIVSFMATANGSIQLSVPDNLRGRVMSVYAMVFLGTFPIGNSLLGTLSTSIGTVQAVSISSFLCIIASVIFSLRFLRKA